MYASNQQIGVNSGSKPGFKDHLVVKHSGETVMNEIPVDHIKPFRNKTSPSKHEMR